MLIGGASAAAIGAFLGSEKAVVVFYIVGAIAGAVSGAIIGHRQENTAGSPSLAWTRDNCTCHVDDIQAGEGPEATSYRDK
jgi:outer membrane lipoprotein SlyB